VARWSADIILWFRFVEGYRRHMARNTGSENLVGNRNRW
jgi:hypothetical protein